MSAIFRAFIYFHSILVCVRCVLYLDIFYVDIIFLNARWKRRYRLSGGNRISVDKINSMVLCVVLPIYIHYNICGEELRRWNIAFYIEMLLHGSLKRWNFWYSFMEQRERLYIIFNLNIPLVGWLLGYVWCYWIKIYCTKIYDTPNECALCLSF